MAHRSGVTGLVSLAVIVTLAVSGGGCSRTATPEERTPLSPTVAPSPTALPTATPEEPTALPPTHTATATVVPSATLEEPTPLPPTVTATATMVPSATPEPTPPPPTETLLPTATVVVEPTSSASSGQVAVRPKGSPLTYEPEFAGVSPASAPPSYDGSINPLTGLPVSDPGTVLRRALLVRFGNDRAARPHSGISQAEVVFEEIMDAWWITRLTGVYLQAEPDKVGPIRSARPFLLELLPAFDGVLVYSGASIGVSELLAQGNYNLIDETRDGDIFFRGTDRPSPHNLYTSVPAARQRVQDRGWEHASAIRGWTFSAEAPAGADATRVDIPYPPTSVVRWTWDAGAGVYRRWVQGAAYTDLSTGQQVGCENVVVLYAKHWESDIVEDSRGATAIGIALRGGERAQIIRDGRVIEGYWWRSESTMLFQFIDANGNHIPLKPGHTWVEVVPSSYRLDIR